MHGFGVVGALNTQTVSPLFAGRVDPDAMLYARQMVERMAPRDHAEEMLVSQMLFAHARVMHLTSLMSQQTTGEGLKIISEYLDRASNTFRRHMLALAEYRRPPRGGISFTVVKQANFAHQQVVKNHESQNKNATNEQGSDPNDQAGAKTPAEAPQLPSDTRRDGLAEILRKTGEAVEELHRAKDSAG